MTKKRAQQKLEKAGYKVVFSMNTGNVIASKGQRTYKSESLNGLIKQIF
jgi:hypothetical protein